MLTNSRLRPLAGREPDDARDSARPGYKCAWWVDL